MQIKWTYAHTQKLYKQKRKYKTPKNFQTISFFELIFPQGPLIFPIITAFFFDN